MPLLRRSQSSASVNTTVSMYTVRRGKYAKALGIINVYIMVSSLVMAILGFLFMKVYHMDKIYTSAGKEEKSDGTLENGLENLWTYGWLPWLLVGIGLGTFVLATLGFLFSGMESKPPLMVYSSLLALLVLFQLFLLYVTFNANALISESNQEDAIKNHLRESVAKPLYFKDKNFRDNWNTIQQTLRCCGFDNTLGENWRRGDYVSMVNAIGNRCYPESCCIRNHWSNHLCTEEDPCTSSPKQCKDAYTERCKKSNNLNNLENNEIKYLNVRGCSPVLQEMYKATLPKVFFFIEIIGALTILVEIIAIALSSAFVAQITRRAKRYNGGMGMDDMELK